MTPINITHKTVLVCTDLIIGKMPFISCSFFFLSCKILLESLTESEWLLFNAISKAIFFYKSQREVLTIFMRWWCPLCSRQTHWVGRDVLCLTTLSTIFQLYRGGQFYWWRKPEFPAKTVNLPQVTFKSNSLCSYSLILCA